MQNEWRLRQIDDPGAVRRIQQELNDLPEALARSLVLRGIDSFEKARNFFRPDPEDLHDPFLMRDMDRAADRLSAALHRGETILVYGDYDVDGTTATALMMRFLNDQGADASYFIPDRYRDGYGLSPRGIDRAAERGADLIIALDCGITAHEMAAYAREQGLDLIICDHHTAGETVPEAAAVLDPKRPDCTYPFKELSGCGVGFKLVQAVMELQGTSIKEAFKYLDLLALSIASDIVPIGGENRILMRESLNIIKEHASPGVRALARRADVDVETCTSSSIVFRLGPRINAAGRMDSAEKAVALLLAEDRGEADRLARDLDSLNQERRSLDKRIREEAFEQADMSTTREYGGTGLGLVISGRLVHLMNGQIWLDSTPGEGSTFHFTIEVEETGGDDRPSRPDVSALEGMRVIVVDDNATSRDFLTRTLEHWGMVAEGAEGGTEALEKMDGAPNKDHPPRLVLLDRDLPETDGVQIATRIRERWSPEEVSIVLMTSMTEAYDTLHADVGVDDSLSKPVTQDRLRTSIERVLGEGAGTEKKRQAAASTPAEDAPSARILLADDDRVTQQLITKILEKHGHEVEVVGTGDDAVEAFQEADYDLILMDVQMPEVNGFEAARRIRGREKDGDTHVPIVALTARATEESRKKCLSAGMDAYIAKPVDSETLLEAVAEMQREGA